MLIFPFCAASNFLYEDPLQRHSNLKSIHEWTIWKFLTVITSFIDNKIDFFTAKIPTKICRKKRVVLVSNVAIIEWINICVVLIEIHKFLVFGCNKEYLLKNKFDKCTK